MGRWAWSTDAWDFDHDGFQDLYIANGYISSLGDRGRVQFFLAPGPLPITIQRDAFG